MNLTVLVSPFNGEVAKSIFGALLSVPSLGPKAVS